MEPLILFLIFVAVAAASCYHRLKVMALEDNIKSLRKQRDALQYRLDGGRYWK